MSEVPGGHSRQTAAKPFWGWHRLQADWAEAIVTAAGVRPGELVLDLGAGTGALTEPLLDVGARVIAVELHPGRVTRLRRRFAAAVADRRLAVVQVDLLAFHWPRRPFRIVANPPFAITSPLIMRITSSDHRLRQADLLLKRSVVRDRVARQQGHASGFTSSAALELPRHAFTPRPPVDVGVLRLTRRRS
ncbi:23S rRNA (adenine-N6)-dimethyltransferase [Friedmanniella endophytica]|uniref:23S rRNA (Adenine-N6)-dimethyltransferase n=1 Tax=Microlunatus kandeliicorticis TaxID=1759536 RepID=A0A7W3IT59_9ACTN|nr:rRNA adenine N-6-methyltransferase family protein [Microlunatus kandeliicorticis]MBA8794750.1 23S rRNA (adenine-N6)-dimethyltransferase [Microlunatus kandeliicorticis]